MLLNFVLGANSKNSGDNGIACHLLSTYCLPGTVLSCLYVKMYSVLSITSENRHYCPLTDEKTEAQRLGDLPKATELLRGKVTCSFPSPHP